MGPEPTVSSLPGLAAAAGILDLLPTALLLVEPGTARTLFANREAHRLAGGDIPMSTGADDYARLYPCLDTAGRPVPSQDMPGPRIARREPFSRLQLDWTTPAGTRTVIASGQLTRLGDGTEVGVVTFEDVTELALERRRARDARDEMEAMLGGVPDAVTAQTRDGTVVYANDAALRRLGYPDLETLAAAPVEELRARFEFTDEDGVPLPMERLPGRQALMGEAPEALTVRHRSPEGGELRWARVQATGVPGPDGRPRMAINVIEDITDIKRAEQGYRFLAEASRVLSGSLDYERTLRTVANLAVPRIADWCGVDLAIDDTRLERVAVAHIDPSRRALARELQERYPSRPGTAIFQVIASGEPQVLLDITDEMLVGAAVDEENLRMIRELGMRSVMIVPMTLRESVLGAITFVSSESGRIFDPQDVALARDLALRAAVAIDNARLYEASKKIAHTLQASLLPPHLPEIPGADLAAVYRPAGRGLEVGGDFYDVFDVADDHWFLVIGDVCGKGTEAAAITALARWTVRAAAVRRRSPSAILRWLNEAMLRQGGERFCTLACAHLDLSGDVPRLEVACGGHPAPVVLRAGGQVEEVGAPGTLLGLVPDPQLEDRATELHPGDTVIVYTDGLTEADAPARIWSEADVAATLAEATGRDASGVVEHLVGAALGGLAEPRDDVAVLALRMR
jgi:PAS domain S-box-containing protein